MPENEQRLSVRVYYEDTDFSGRVYHASYFRFFERGRTEWLRAFGLQHGDLARSSALAFAVTRLDAEFLAPALIDDVLDVATRLEALRGPVLNFRQIASRGGVSVASASIDVVAIRGDRATRPPRELLQALPQLRRQ